MGFPTHSPTTMAIATESVKAPVSIGTPALAKANSGIITKLTPQVQSDFQPLQGRDGFSRRPLYRLQDGLTSVRIVPRFSLEKSSEMEAGGV